MHSHIHIHTCTDEGWCAMWVNNKYIWKVEHCVRRSFRLSGKNLLKFIRMSQWMAYMMDECVANASMAHWDTNTHRSTTLQHYVTTRWPNDRNDWTIATGLDTHTQTHWQEDEKILLRKVFYRFGLTSKGKERPHNHNAIYNICDTWYAMIHLTKFPSGNAIV